MIADTFAQAAGGRGEEFLTDPVLASVLLLGLALVALLVGLALMARGGRARRTASESSAASTGPKPAAGGSPESDGAPGKAAALVVDSAVGRAQERSPQVPHLSDNGAYDAASTVPSPVSLSTATFDQLRSVGMSTTQAQRVIRRREQDPNAFSSVEELDSLPGFPRSTLAAVKPRCRP